MVNNGTVNYDHDRDGTHSEVEGCSVRNLDAIISLSNLCHHACTTCQIRSSKFEIIYLL